MSRFLKVAGVTALVAVMALATVAVVSADGPQGGRFGQVGNLWERMHEAIANALGVTVEEYDTAVDTARGQVLQQAVDEGLLTEEQAEQMQQGYGPGMMGFGMRGPSMMRSGMRGPGSSLIDVAAVQLGMSVQDLVDKLEVGQSIADVAAEQGVAVDDIAAAWLADREEWLDQAVAAERITQEQADEMLAHMQEEVLEHLQATWPWENSCEDCEEYMEGLGGFGGHGMRGSGSRGSFGGCGL